ncbi:MAG: SLBB domain-containing protein [Sediminibacterium sp.]
MKRILPGVVFLLAVFNGIRAQVPDTKNVSAINIEAMSNAQLEAYLQQAQLSGLSEEELVAKGRERGLSDAQIERLRERITQLQGNKKATTVSYESRKPVSFVKPAAPQNNVSQPQIFGADFFSNTNLTFEPNMRLATPGNYVLGVDDELVLDIYGFSEKTSKLKLNTEGQVRIPNIGPVNLSGLTIEEAKIKLKQRLSPLYPGLATGKTSLQLSLGQIRTIRVILIGEIRNPGTYSLSSLSTIANALYLSGGPSHNGSFRKISLIRAGKKLVQFDLYDFLLRGDLSSNLMLKEEDIIKVEPYAIRVTIDGAVKKPGIYECMEGECLQDLIHIYAGGLSDNANKQRISIRRIGDSTRHLLDVPYEQLKIEKLKSSDVITIGHILEQYDNQVKVGGAVYFPGNYSLEKNPELRSLLVNALLKENAFRGRALLYRLNEKGESTIIPVNLLDAISKAVNLPLVKEDSLHVFAKAELEEAATVSITGEVNKPGQYAFHKGMQVEDLVLLGGGLNDRAASKSLEVLRRIRKDTAMSDTAVYNMIFKLDIPDSLRLNKDLSSIQLEPYDVVNVKNLPRNKQAGTVTIRGELLFPGTYPLNTKQDRVSDLVKRAGGVLNTGFPEGAFLLRNTFGTGSGEELKKMKKSLVYNQLSDSATEEKLVRRLDSSKQLVAFQLSRALENPRSKEDILLEDGDILEIPKQLSTVSVFGSVQFEKKVLYQPGLGARAMIREAGGFQDNAKRNGVYVLYPNGRVATAHKSFLLFRSYPRLSPGAEVYVPEKKKRKGLSPGELMGISSSIVGLSGLIFGILNLSK